jgi:hypothetical protein
MDIESFLDRVKWHLADRPVPFGAQKLDVHNGGFSRAHIVGGRGAGASRNFSGRSVDKET